MNCMISSLKFLSEYSTFFFFSTENIERRLIRRRKKYTEYHDNVIRWQCFHFFQAVILCKVKILFNSCIYCVMLLFLPNVYHKDRSVHLTVFKNSYCSLFTFCLFDFALKKNIADLYCKIKI